MQNKEPLGFYGAEKAPREVRELYLKLKKCWCAETCAARMRADWSEENRTLGQCSITSFLVQDLLGGDVMGLPLPDGGCHCFNVVNGFRFDLTSEQFRGKPLDYDNCSIQRREEHFAEGDKLERYELLKKRFEELE